MIKLKIDYQSKLSHIQDIDKRNEMFDSLSDEDKRKEVAWDALGLIKSEMLLGSTLIDIDRYWSYELLDIKTPTSKEFQKILTGSLPQCRVCAKGATMVSVIRLGNDINSDNPNRCDGIYIEYDDDEKCYSESIAKGFSVDTLDNMESAYESGSSLIDEEQNIPYYIPYISIIDDDVLKVSTIPNNYEMDVRLKKTLLLANIFCNIIVNGDFESSDKKIYVDYIKDDN